jgi:predicted P-loop ATPase
LVLCGQNQGTGKTSFFRNLLPADLQKYLIEHKIDAKDKDSIYNLVKGLLVLDDEFGGLATRDVKDFKKVADTNMVDIRLPYSSYYAKLKRRASLCGTSNEKDVLKDVTGNRRILPINVEKIDYNRLISLNTANLWLEAYQLYKNGFDWKIFSNDDIDFLQNNTIKNIENMPVEDLFFENFSIEKNNFFEVEVVLSQGQILNFLNGIANFVVTKYDVKDIITKNKLENKLYKKYGKTMRGYCLYTQNNE